MGPGSRSSHPLAVGQPSCPITLWQIPTTQVIATIALRNSSNNGLAFSQTDQSLVVNQSSGFYIWNLDPDRWQNLACHIVQRNLTQQEWQRYVIGESYRKVCADLP
jgi:sugar lactone lactonase YvrE